MQTQLAEFIRNSPEGREAESILRACMHCGFCLATCPTYQLLGDERDSPRGRIYLMKQVLEGQPVSARTQLHLDRCLTCRSCESTCPSGVRYGRLVDIGRQVVEQKVRRKLGSRLFRGLLRHFLLSPRLFGFFLGAGRTFRPLLPAGLKATVPPKVPPGAWPTRQQARRMLLLEGCVQPALAPSINAATARVLDRAGISLVRVRDAGCCGAVSQHLGAPQAALQQIRRNIDAWWPELEKGAEAIVITASGCGAMVKDYGHLLAHDPAYAEKARRVAELARDISEVVADCWPKLKPLLDQRRPPVETLAFHAPCTLQHGLKLKGGVERLLADLGVRLAPVADPHLCCGSAGTYSILQPELSQRLRANKLAALQAGRPQIILTANIGCLTHLQSATELPVRHWVELVDQVLN
ncbi:glycolate oxidase iron-sulfur subunit [Burkholderiales bacterium]|nr:MAG: glycolate oxidase subunit GlcF [Burkholderiales bacterium]CAG1012154.1 glycolate oxidase iron-sulfur subunit [Burkholderiales bacterium]